MDRPHEDSTVINSLTQIKLCRSKSEDNTGFSGDRAIPRRGVSRLDLGDLPPHFAKPAACLG
jgi:hypothetical protein